MLPNVPSGYSSDIVRSANFNNGVSRRGHRGERRDSGVRSVNHVTEAIIGDSIAVHRELGPGLLEHVYEECLAMLLTRRGLKVERQKPVAVKFRDVTLGNAYRIDLLVENCVVVEVKAISNLEPVHSAQLNTYLRFSECDVGLLINFNVSRLTDGLRRVIRGHDAASQTLRSSVPSVRNSVKQSAQRGQP